MFHNVSFIPWLAPSLFLSLSRIPLFYNDNVLLMSVLREPAKRVKLDSSGGDQPTAVSASTASTTTPIPVAPPTSVAMTTQQPDPQQQWAAAYQQQWAGAYAYGQPVSQSSGVLCCCHQ